MEALQLYPEAQTTQLPADLDHIHTSSVISDIWDGLLNMVKSTLDMHRKDIRLQNLKITLLDLLKQLTQLLVSSENELLGFFKLHYQV